MRSPSIDSDERAATPVIGIILMVMVTVLLAAVVGSFALGLASFVDTGAPAADIQFEHDGTALEVVHEGGEGIPEGQVEFDIGGQTRGADECNDDNGWAGDGETVSAGDVCVLENVETDDTVRMIWFDRNSSGIVAEWSGPDAS